MVPRALLQQALFVYDCHVFMEFASLSTGADEAAACTFNQSLHYWRFSSGTNDSCSEILLLEHYCSFPQYQRGFQRIEASKDASLAHQQHYRMVSLLSVLSISHS